MASTQSPSSGNTLRLPHPFLTTYSINPTTQSLEDRKLIQLVLSSTQPANSNPLPATTGPLHNNSLFFTDLRLLQNGARPAENINTPWGRARRSPESTFHWTSSSAPTIGQLWLLVYGIFTLHPDVETFRLKLSGASSSSLVPQLTATQLAIPHPANTTTSEPVGPSELLVLRSTFWQGAASPFGSRPVWALELPTDLANPGTFIAPLSNFPLAVEYTTTTKFPHERVHTRHPVRPAKPQRGSLIYSRYIPHLDEMFSMVASTTTTLSTFNSSTTGKTTLAFPRAGTKPALSTSIVNTSAVSTKTLTPLPCSQNGTTRFLHTLKFTGQRKTIWVLTTMLEILIVEGIVWSVM